MVSAQCRSAAAWVVQLVSLLGGGSMYVNMYV